MKSIDVVVGVIPDSTGAAVLVSQRKSEDAHFGKWEFPGGKIDAGETAELALRRELDEELGLRIIAFHFLETFSYQYPHLNVNLKFYCVSEYAGRAYGREGQLIAWQPITELDQLDMLEANQVITKRIAAAGQGYLKPTSG